MAEPANEPLPQSQSRSGSKKKRKEASTERIGEKSIDRFTFEPFKEWPSVVLLDIRPNAFDQFAVMHARRTSGLARTTAKTGIKMAYGFGIELKASFMQSTHGDNTATR